jgi:hypothetical protein
MLLPMKLSTKYAEIIQVAAATISIGLSEVRRR